MILSEIKQYLIQHKRATLDDLAIHFDTESEAMTGMLEHWIRKSRIVEYKAHGGCCSDTGCCSKACSKCGGESNMIIYEWIS